MARSAKELFHRSEQDFILLSEFAEIRHGPQPLCTIPEKGEGAFDIGAFSVRIFSTDFQQGQSEDFTISPDSQVLLTEPNDGLFAYVHYFALHDIQARGYIRQYCLSYLTSSPSKLIDQFQNLQKDISEVTSIFKCGNHSSFMCDLKHKLADLNFSLKEVDNDLNNDSENTIKYDSCQEDIPETNKDALQKDTEFTNNIIETIEKAMKTENNIKLTKWIKTQESQLPTIVRTEGNSHFYTSGSFIQDEYQPKRVMAHLSQRFTRQLRSLQELSLSGYALAIGALKDVLMKYNRSELALNMELHETELLSPLSSLLAIGRVPLVNVMERRPLPPAPTPCSYKLTSHDSGDIDCITSDPHFEPTVFLHNGPILYVDLLPRQHNVSVIDPFDPSYNNELLIDPHYAVSSQRSSYNTPDTIPSPTPEKTNQPIISPSELSDRLHAISGNNDKEDSNKVDLTRSLPTIHSHKIQLPRLRLHSTFGQSSEYFTPSTPYPSVDPWSYQISTGLPNHHGYLPFISSVDLIERNSSFKPGREILTLLKDLPELDPRDEKLVEKYIRTLWLFVGGYSSQYQVIPWQTNPIDLIQLPNICLVGVSSHSDNPIPSHLKRYLSYWDWTKNLLSVPNYTGHLLNPILTRTREKKNEDVLLTLIESVLIELSLKLFVYFNGYCLLSEVIIKQVSPPEPSAKKLHSVFPTRDKVQFLNMLSIKGSDIDIVEHLTDVIRNQQLNEWFTNDQVPPTVILRNHYCEERVCKPKRLF